MSPIPFSLRSGSGLNIHAQEWKPDGKIRAVIVLVHGLGEHCNRYGHVAEFYNHHGITVLSFDHVGHGKSEGIRGHELSYDSTCDDIQMLVDTAKSKYPDLPIFLYGHSLGAAQVLYMILSRKPQIDGAIATSPVLRPAIPPSAFKLALARLLNNLIPAFTMENDLDFAALSRDEKVVKAYKDDPLVTSKVSARLGLELIENGVWILENANKLSMPLFLMQGSADKIVDPEWTKMFGARAPEQWITFKVWEGFYHELHNEPEKKDVLDHQLNWITRRLSN